MKTDYSALYKVLNYLFRQETYLTMALTHRSASSQNNERLEFLGDSLLNYIAAEALFERFPTASEGELTRSRATLVREETLAEIAQQMNLGDYLQLGGGELKSGGWRRPSILADALEAVFGAVYLDSDMNTCRQVVLRLLQTRLDNLSPHKINKDPKTCLQEYLQAQQRPLPIYRVLTIQGDPPTQHFEVECMIDGLAVPAYGTGDSRRRAEQAAAHKALNILHGN
ncbi:ribonuclease III [Beggiatoa leptomitoformis]|uniref:Ribonuclease 3 n=1 Tax=Beggiatoa leptomitoformis TaxID=288004 RepID=A0A650GDS5_9GAMM|nr:ribonuclease III [Beggiatoa leptomitoformis]ALG66675.1 ribonuclease III [Beggiatoa leptomitoformis]QGX04028.1 ribonuclease III [Beggiatoa leptomitoformis]